MLGWNRQKSRKPCTVNGIKMLTAKRLVVILMLFLFMVSCSTRNEGQIINTHNSVNQIAEEENGDLREITVTNSENRPTNGGLEISDDGCIRPLESFAFETVIQNDGSRTIPGNNAFVLPVDPWLVEAELQEISSETGIFSSVEFERSENGAPALWIHRKSGFQINQIDIFYPDTQSWGFIPGVVEGENIAVSDLYILSDGSVFGKNQWFSHLDYTKSNTIPVLSKFNESTNQFELVDNIDSIPEYSVQEMYDVTIVPDFDGGLWILINDDAIYHYNPKTEEGYKHISLSDVLVGGAVVDEHTNLYFTDLDNGNTVDFTTLYKYSIDTRELNSINTSGLQPWPNYSTLLIDHNENLWLGGIAWLEPGGGIFQILPSPVFVVNVGVGNSTRWRTPLGLLESSDGRLWFIAQENGMVWLDPEVGKYCWFTTYSSNIIEDENQNLWMVVDEKLYRLELAR